MRTIPTAAVARRTAYGNAARMIARYRVLIDPHRPVDVQFEAHALEFRRHAESFAGDADKVRQLLAAAADCERLAAAWRDVETQLAALERAA